MIHTLQRVSGVCFYLLGTVLFIAWSMLEWNLNARMAAILLQSLDLPFAFSAIVYGGTSVYQSVRDDAKPSRVLPWLIAIPLLLLFLAIVVLNFG